MTLGGNGQSIVIQIQVDVLLFKARQIGRDLEVVALIGDVGAEGVGEGLAEVAPRLIEEVLLDLLHPTERINYAQCMIAIQHDKDLLYKLFGFIFAVPLGTIMILCRRCEQIQQFL